MLHARQDYNERIQDSANIIPEDEPVFLIRATDNISADIVEEWARRASMNGANSNILDAARSQAIKMREWQSIHGSKVADM